MPDLSLKPNTLDTSPLRNAVRKMVDEQIIPGASWALLQGRELVDVQCVGWADIEARTALRTDHIFRIFSYTKLVSSVCALQLIESGKLGLDDPVARYLPQVQNLQVQRAGASSSSKPKRSATRSRSGICSRTAPGSRWACSTTVLRCTRPIPPMACAAPKRRSSR